MNTERYARLIAALDPAIVEVAVYDAEDRLVGASGPRLPALAPSERVCDGASIARLEVRRGDRCLGWLRTLRSPGAPAGERESAAITAVLQFLADDLAAADPATHGPDAGPDGDAAATPRVAGLPPFEAPADLDAAVREAVRLLECQGAVLYLPALGRAVVHSTGILSSAETDRAQELLRTHLWPLAQHRRRRLVLNRFRVTEDGPAEPFRMVCAPVHRGGLLRGLLAGFSLRGERRFDERDAYPLERLAIAAARLLDPEFDAATGLLSRQAFEQRVTHQRAAYPHHARCLVYANVDRFHVVNEAAGMAAGDGVLRAVAQRLATADLPEYSFVGRLSGDRFVAFLENSSLNVARLWAERVQAAVAALPLPEPCQGLPLTISFGIAAVVDGAAHGRALADAELACKAAKDRGRARIEIYADSDLSLIRRHDDLRIFRLLQEALTDGRFRLYAQPVESLRERGASRQYEILVRMLGPLGEVIEPAAFLSAARRYQVLDKLDDWVLYRSLTELATLDRGRFPPGTRFWINVSGQSLADPGFAERARALVKRHALPAGSVGFEITENAAVADLAAARGFIERLRDVGCETKLDDFGTGLSSLAYLKELPVTGLKIDGGFVRGVLGDPRARSVVTAVLGIAGELGLDTTAECIETQAVADLLASMGVAYGQGYLYGRPEPLRDLFASPALRNVS